MAVISYFRIHCTTTAAGCPGSLFSSSLHTLLARNGVPSLYVQRRAASIQGAGATDNLFPPYRRRFSIDDIASFAKLTNDVNPFHRRDTMQVVPGAMLLAAIPARVSHVFHDAIMMKQVRMKRHSCSDEKDSTSSQGGFVTSTLFNSMGRTHVCVLASHTFG